MDIAAFRIDFPEFASSVTYPDALIQSNYDAALLIAPFWDEERPVLLLTAHLIKLGVSGGGTVNNGAGILTGSSIDSVSVSVAAAPFKGITEWWLLQTNYGAQLLLWIKSKTAGGFVVGGLPERRAFRKFRGGF